MHLLYLNINPQGSFPVITASSLSCGEAVVMTALSAERSLRGRLVPILTFYKFETESQRDQTAG